MRKITDMIDTVLKNKDSESKILEVKQEVNRWSNHFPLYQ
jgi:glycine/serine hydroxymethyltransferase